MKYFLLIISVIVILASSQSSSVSSGSGTSGPGSTVQGIITLDCDILNCTYFRPDPMFVTGMATGYYPSEIVIISFTVETLDLNITAGLTQNSNITNTVIRKIKALGITEQEISTAALSISPQYDFISNQTTNTSSNVFKGFRVDNSITITTKKLNLSGSIIDVAVLNGVINIDNISFDATNSTQIQIKNQLITNATNDAQQQAQIALKVVKLGIQSIKGLSINNFLPPPQLNSNLVRPSISTSSTTNGSTTPVPPQFNSTLVSPPIPTPGPMTGSTTPVFNNQQSITVSVSVSFLIG